MQNYFKDTGWDKALGWEVTGPAQARNDKGLS